MKFQWAKYKKFIKKNRTIAVTVLVVIAMVVGIDATATRLVLNNTIDRIEETGDEVCGALDENCISVAE